MPQHRAATYVRSASGPNATTSSEGLEQQETNLAEWLMSHPEVTIEEHFRDVAVAGTTPMEQRPAGARLMQLVHDGKIDTLIISGMDRLSRDALVATRLRERLGELGVRLIDVTASRGPRGKVMGFRGNRVVTYARVSSDQQEKNETIKTQRPIFDEWFAAHPEKQRVGDYEDDGVSGTVAFEDRPGGGRLFRDARAGMFDYVLVVRPDRLGRTTVDMLETKAKLGVRGVELIGIREEFGDDLIYTIKAAMAQEERKKIRERSLDGLMRAAREGRYIGGVIPYGYRPEGEKPNIRLVINEEIVWGDWTAAEVVRHIFRRIVEDGWSCRQIADELNALEIPTAYQIAGKGRRVQAQSAMWRPGRILNLARLRLLRGEQTFGKRAVKRGMDSQVVVGQVPALIPVDVWEAAQVALSQNRPIPALPGRVSYMLRGKIRSAACGVNYCGTPGDPPKFYYRCNGKTAYRGPHPGKCPCRDIPGPWLENIVWNDVELALLSPGTLIAQLQREHDQLHSDGQSRTRRISDRDEIAKRLAELAAQTKVASQQLIAGRLTEEIFDDLTRDIRAKEAVLHERLNGIDAELSQTASVVTVDVMERLRERLDEGLSRHEQREIIQVLVKQITVTNVDTGGRKPDVHIHVEYAFGGDTVVENHTPKDCRQQQARSWPES